MKQKKSVLLDTVPPAMQGLATITILLAVNRELTAHCGGSAINVVLPPVCLLLWTAGAYYAMRQIKANRRLELIATMLLPVTVIAGTVCGFIIPNFSSLPRFFTLLLTAGAATLPCGIISALLYRQYGNLDALRTKNISWLLGAITGAFGYNFFFQVRPLPELLTLPPAILYFMIFMLIRHRRQARIQLVGLLLGTIMVLGFNWLDRRQAEFKDALQCSGKNRAYFFDTIESSDGRYSRRRPRHYRPGQFSILKNGRVLWQMPRDYYRYNKIALVSVLQNTSTDRQRVLLVGNPFTKVPYLLQDMDSIVHIDMVCEKLIFAQWAMEYGLIPEASADFRLLFDAPTIAPIEWQNICLPQKYDLIIVLDNIASLPFNHLFFQCLKSSLKPNGVISVGLLRPAPQENFIRKQLNNLFPVVKRFSTPDLLILLSGNGPTTASAQLLDQRVAADNHLPPGIIAAINSCQVFSTTPSQFLPRNSGRFPAADYRLLVTALLGYLLLRFWISRYHNFSALFSATENGLYLGAVTLVALNYFQTAVGKLYGSGGIFIGLLLTGVLIGIIMARPMPRLRGAIMLLSLALPLALNYFRISTVLPYLPLALLLPLLFLTGVAGGSCHTLIERQSTAANRAKLPAWTLGGLILPLLLQYLGLSAVNWLIVIVSIRSITAISVIKYSRE